MKKKDIMAKTISDVNSMRTNLWKHANDKESWAKAAFYIKTLASMTGFSKSGLICSFILMAAENGTIPEMEHVIDLWNKSDIKAEFDKIKAGK